MAPASVQDPTTEARGIRVSLLYPLPVDTKSPKLLPISVSSWPLFTITTAPELFGLEK